MAANQMEKVLTLNLIIFSSAMQPFERIHITGNDPSKQNNHKKEKEFGPDRLLHVTRIYPL